MYEDAQAMRRTQRMLTYDLKNTDTPLYEALYLAVKTDILSGRLKADEKLPSKRRMASNNGISTITVENAYGLLLSEGYIYSKPKSGFYVCGIAEVDAVGSTIAERPQHRKEDAGRNDMQRTLVADFSNNQTPPDLFPFEAWAKATKSALSEHRKELLENSPSCGIRQLREDIARHLKEYRGLDVEPDSIVVGAGSEYLYGLITQLVGRNRKYGIEDPGYMKQELVYKAQEVDVEYLDVDDKGLCPSSLEEKGVDVIHTTPSHQYPTGIVMPISRRYELLAWASCKPGRYIIEDDYDSELRLDGRPMPSFKSIDREGCVIYVNTFSKTLCSTVRISYMVLPPKLLAQFNERLSFYSCTVSTFEQFALARFMEGGMLATHINRLRTYYRRKRDAFTKALRESPLGDRIEIMGEKAGLHFVMKVSTTKKETDVVEKAKANGIGLCTLSSFKRSGNAPTNEFVMNYATLDIDNLDDIVSRLCRTFE